MRQLLGMRVTMKLNRRPIKRVGGKGDFSLPDKYFHDGRYYVGEAGGFKTSCGVSG